MGGQVVATAGHVDHGKSSLIIRLTGIDPDRFAEEKRRGLTIDLGYAWCTLPSGREVGFVDVPGHERFIRNMLAGVGPVKLVLFVVAADEGWKPQSEEHLSIIDVLGVWGGVVALTKSDLAGSPEELSARAEEIASLLRGTALEGSRIIPCSSTTGQGLDEVRGALDDMIAGAPEPEGNARPRLFVDRVFSIRGAGTVVTGTLTGGRLRVGDEVEIDPGGARARIRGLQTHKRAVDEAVPVSRVAVNLAGVDRAGIGRGDVLVAPGQWRTTRRIEAELRPVRGLGRPLSERGAFKLYAGAGEYDARIRFVGEDGDGGTFARMSLSRPAVLDVFEEFVIRESGRRETVGGGKVLDVWPPIKPGRDAADRLEARARAGPSGLAPLVVAERGAVRKGDLFTSTGSSNATGAIESGDWFFSPALFAAARDAVTLALRAFHEEHPQRAAADVVNVRVAAEAALAERGVGSYPDSAGPLIEEMERSGAILKEGPGYRLPEFAPEKEPEGLAALTETVAKDPASPPTVAELVAAGHSRESIAAAIASGDLVKISSDIVMTKSFVDGAQDIVRAEAGRGITVSDFRERLGTSRKYALPLLEYFDRKGVTRRQGDLRFAAGAAAAG